jgi:Mlc titration factor MtfA (ptsG expression regulator)
MNAKKIIITIALFLQCFLCLSTFSSDEFRLFVDSSKDNNLKAFFREVEALIPPKMKEVLAFPIEIRFKEMGPLQEKMADKDKEFTNGFTEGKAIILNNLFLPEIALADHAHQSLTTHGNLFQKAKAVIIHELTHLFMNEKDQNIEQCGQSQSEIPLKQKIDQYRHIMDWHHKGLLNKFRQHNKKISTSPDPYEYTSFKESLPVMMEFFLLEPSEFKQRRPATYQAIQNIFNYNPDKCSARASYMATLNNIETEIEEENTYVNIDPNRVYQIHYMIAGKYGSNPFGHSMFRLVICAPERTTVGPECLDDVAYHVVVSYLGVDERKSNPVKDWFKAVLGGFRSEVRLSSFTSNIETYTLKSRRGMIGLPIKLTDKEKTMMIDKMLQDIHEYSGDYKIITENCSSLANNVIASALPNYKNSTIETPQTVFNKLSKHGLIDKKLLKNEMKNQKNNLVPPTQYYSFPPEEDLFIGRLSHIKKILPNFPIKTLKSYFDLSVEKKRELFNKSTAEAKTKKDKSFINQSFMGWQNNHIRFLINEILLKQKKIIKDEFQIDSLKTYSNPKDEELHKRALRLLDQSKKIEETITTPRYGALTRDEFKQANEKIKILLTKEFLADVNFVQDALQEKTSKEIEHIKSEQDLFEDFDTSFAKLLGSS